MDLNQSGHSPSQTGMNALMTGAPEAPAHSPSQTGVDALLVMTPPADTPQRMGAREAAQLLSSLRRPKEQTSALVEAKA